MRKKYDTERTGDGFGGYIVDCLECGETFEAQRYDAAFCCDAHRMAYHRREKRIAKRRQQTIEMVSELVKDTHKWAVGENYEALVKIQAMVNDKLEWLEVPPDYIQNRYSKPDES